MLKNGIKFMFLQEHDECFECMEKENRICDVKYWFQAVIDQLYGVEKFNSDDLERYINELTNYLGMKMMRKGNEPMKLAVVRENRTVDMKGLLEEWKNKTIQYSKNLINTGT